MRRALLGLLAASVVGATALWTAIARPAIDPSSCKLRHPATTIDSLRYLPSAIAQDLQTRIRPRIELQAPAMSDRSGPFNATDVITDPAVPSRRFVHAGRSADLWFVWYEQGGRGYTTHLVVYRTGTSGASAELVTHLSMSPDNLCGATDAALDGQVPKNASPTESW